MEPGFLVATGCRCDLHLLYRLVGVNVRILCVNLTLPCWCRVSNVLFWLIFPDMVQSCNNLHTTYSHLPQANTARVIFSWNDVDPTMPNGSDAMRHTTRSLASLNLLGGLPDPPPVPSDTRSFTFRVNNVCISSVNQS